jgi:hypothetical protein
MLQIWNGASPNGAYVTVDTISAFYVNSTDNSTIGYDVEYLDPERKMIVAGLHPLEFAYSSLKTGTTEFVVRNPDGDKTRFSTMIASPCKGMYSQMLPSTSPIGIWNVTMYGNETLTFSFNVVADENNYIDFFKNTYNSDEAFQVYVIHDVKVLLKFYKQDINGDWIATGGKFFVDKVVPNGLVTIDRNLVTPTSGNWKVEMWECDNRIEIRLLSSYTATVTVTGVSPTDYMPSGDIFPQLDPALGFIVGLIITMFCLLLPFAVGKALGSDGIPTFVYGVTACLGVGVSVVLGLFPFWIIPFVLTVGVIILAVKYIFGGVSDDD